MIRFTTAGESHGKALVAIVEGLPAGLRVRAEDVDRQLSRRMAGHGRGGRMKIESDRIEWISGIRGGETLGSPVAMRIENRDWANWEDVMSPEPAEPGSEPRRQVKRPRPGHADLAGSLKYDRTDARDILERASARETAARVAAGALCRCLLAEFDVEIGSHVVELGGIGASIPDELPRPLDAATDRSPVRCLDPVAERAMVRAIDEARAAGDTLGGVAEVVVLGLVPGLGSHVSWDRKLDGRLAGLLMSIPAVKGVEVGLGFEAARRSGSAVHDAIIEGFARRSNRAGGLEGGMTTGEALVCRVAMKPISTLMRPLDTVHLESGAPAQAQAERSDVTAVPAMGVVAEALVAIALADAMQEKFGGDSLREMRTNFDAYCATLADRGWTRD